MVEERTKQMYDIVMNIMTSGRFNAFPAAMETLVTSAVSFSTSKQQHERVMGWFTNGKITDQDDQVI